MSHPFIEFIVKQFYLRPNSIVLREYVSKQTVSFKTLEHLVSDIQQEILHRGIEKGDKILLYGRNNINWCATYLASILLGNVIVPIDYRKPPKDVQMLAQHCDYNSPQFLDNY